MDSAQGLGSSLNSTQIAPVQGLEKLVRSRGH